MIVSNKVSVGKKGFKYFIACNDAKRIKRLCIFIRTSSAYRKDVDETKYISFLVKHD